MAAVSPTIGLTQGLCVGMFLRDGFNRPPKKLVADAQALIVNPIVTLDGGHFDYFGVNKLCLLTNVT